MTRPLKISEEAAVQMPMKTVASLILLVAIGTWAYFGIIEKQNKMATQLELMSKDVENNLELNGHEDRWVHCPRILSST